MNENSNYTEYTVEQKAEGKYLTRRILLVLLYVVFTIGYFLFFTIGPIKLYPLIAILPIFLWILIFFTWRYVAVEHEYTIASGTMTFSDIYGNRSRRTLLEAKIKDMSEIAPLTEESRKKCTGEGISKVYDFLSTQSSPDAYYAICAKEGGVRIAIFFEATEKSLKIMKFYNSSAVTLSKTRY